MATAREIMTPNAECVRSSDTVLDAARKMAEMGVGALPICGEDDKLKGMLTDRDIVVKVIAQGKEARAVHVSELAQGKPIMCQADDSVEKVLHTMAEHKIRRLPVLDNDRLVGIVAQADVARSIDEKSVGELVEALSTD